MSLRYWLLGTQVEGSGHSCDEPPNPFVLADDHPCVVFSHFASAVEHLCFVQLLWRVLAAELEVRWAARAPFMKLREDTPDHPVLSRPWEFGITSLHVYTDALKDTELTLDLTLSRGSEVKRLRFRGVMGLVIGDGFPDSSGLRILDVRAQQLEGIGVRVANFEPTGGCPEFWAREVAEVPIAEVPFGTQSGSHRERS